MRDEPGERVLPPRDERHRLGELVPVAQLTPSTSISRNARSPTRSGASWVDRPTTTTRPACETRRTAVWTSSARPSPRRRPRALVARPLPPAATRSASSARTGGRRPGARARRGPRRGRRAAPRRYGRARRPRPPGRSDRRRGRPSRPAAIRASIARTAIETGSMRRRPGRGSPTGNTWSAGTRTRSRRAPSRWMPTRLMFEDVATADAAGVAMPARRHGPHGDPFAARRPPGAPAPTASIPPRTRAPGHAGTGRARPRHRDGRGSSGSRSRRGRPPRAGRAPRRRPARPRRGRRRSASSPGRSVTAAFIRSLPPRRAPTPRARKPTIVLGLRPDDGIGPILTPCFVNRNTASAKYLQRRRPRRGRARRSGAEALAETHRWILRTPPRASVTGTVTAAPTMPYSPSSTTDAGQNPRRAPPPCGRYQAGGPGRGASRVERDMPGYHGWKGSAAAS